MSASSASEMGKVFRVQMYEFSCENLQALEPCDPYLKIDFDNFKIFKTNAELKTQNPEWSFKAGFQYEMNYLEKLKMRYLKVQCFNKAGSQQIGEAAVDLQTMACGPSHFKLTLRDAAGQEKGQLKFTCAMKMVSPNLTVICQDLSLTMLGCPASAKMSISCTLSEDLKELPHSSEGKWDGPIVHTFDTSLSDLLKAPETEHLSFVIIDDTGVRQGEAQLEFRKAFSTKADTFVNFKVPVTYTATSEGGNIQAEPMGAVGELEGVLIYSNLPVYAQMIGGVCVDSQVEGGYWLYEGLPFPHCMAQAPPLWQDHLDVRGMEHFSLQPEGEDGEINFDEIDDEWIHEAIEKIDLPPPWEKRREHSTGERRGRAYFLDPRSKRTTWRDPRFLPENWDQRVDPQTGKVYFQFHRTRQTTYADPRGCPVGWDMRLSREGEIYFAYLPSMRTTFIDPRGLPDTHDAALDDSGRMYFRNHEEKTTMWDDPRADQQEVTLTKWRQAQSTRWWKEQVWRELEEMNRRADLEERPEEEDLVPPATTGESSRIGSKATTHASN